MYTVEGLHNEVLEASEINPYTGHFAVKVAHRTAHNRTWTELFIRRTGHFFVEASVVDALDCIRCNIND